MSAAQIFLEILVASGVRHIFGNPGSTELPLMDALLDEKRLQYILALHEIPAMAMADAYAQATRTPGVVNLHASCGVGNAMGMLYNAWCSGTPLLVTAGQQDRRLLPEEPVLAGDTVGVTRPWTKWSHEVHRAGDVASSARRAIRAALSPPTGPVFLSLPVDLQSEAVAPGDISPAAPGPAPTVPEAGQLEQASRLLVQASSPVILAGCRVTEYAADEQLERLAQQIGAPVYSETHASNGRLPITSSHPLYAGALPLWSPDIRRLLAGHDLAFIVGMDFLRQYIYHDPPSPAPEGLRLVQLDSNPDEIGKNYAVEIGLAGSIPLALTALSAMAGSGQGSGQRRAALERCQRISERRRQEQAVLRAAIEASAEERPIPAQNLCSALAKVLPRDAVIVEEAPTTHQNLIARLGAIGTASGYFGHRGWALGWGAGAAAGVKLAWPERPVVALLGDGAALYGIQALWTASHLRLPVVYVIANNGQYKILKDVGAVMGLPRSKAGRHLGLDINEPRVDFVKLAEGFGVDAHHVRDPEEVSQRVEAGLRAGAPLLLDVSIRQ